MKRLFIRISSKILQCQTNVYNEPVTHSQISPDSILEADDLKEKNC